jgi:hypothetical protein
MKRSAPVEGALGPKIVPFNCDANSIDISIKGTPTIFHLTPSLLLGRTTRIHPV